MSKYTFDTTTSHEGKVYHAGSEYDLDDAVAHGLGFKVTPKAKPQPEVKQVDDYQNKQMTSKGKK